MARCTCDELCSSLYSIITLWNFFPPQILVQGIELCLLTLSILQDTVCQSTLSRFVCLYGLSSLVCVITMMTCSMALQQNASLFVFVVRLSKADLGE